jgi:hypothetical protein
MMKLISSTALGLSVIASLALAPSAASANSDQSEFGLSLATKATQTQSFSQTSFNETRFDRRDRIGHRVHPHDFTQGRFLQPQFNSADLQNRFDGYRSRRLTTLNIFQR